MTNCLHSYMRACPCLSAEAGPAHPWTMPQAGAWRLTPLAMSTWPHDGMWYYPHVGGPRDAGVGASRPLSPPPLQPTRCKRSCQSSCGVAGGSRETGREGDLDGAGEGGRAHPRRRTADKFEELQGLGRRDGVGRLTLERMRSPYTRLAWAPRRGRPGLWAADGVSNPAPRPCHRQRQAPTAATPSSSTHLTEAGISEAKPAAHPRKH